MTTISQIVTAEELLAMPQGEPCELIAGEVVVMTPAGYQHCRISSKIDRIVGWHVERNKLGCTLTTEPGFLIRRDPDTVRCPDFAFVRQDRQPEEPEKYFPGAPDLAVEVISPTDRLGDVDDKTKQWLDAGTPLVWVVYPQTRSVVVHRPGQAPRILHEQDVITGEEVLPGFECRVGEFFED